MSHQYYNDAYGHALNKTSTYQISLSNDARRQGFVDDTPNGKRFMVTGIVDNHDQTPHIQFQDESGKPHWFIPGRYQFTRLTGGTRRRKHRRRKTKLIRKYR